MCLQDIRKAVTLMKNIAVQLEKDNQTEKVCVYPVKLSHTMMYIVSLSQNSFLDLCFLGVLTG